jgi:hypothetical protein
MRAKCPAHFLLLDFITLITSGYDNNSYSFNYAVFSGHLLLFLRSSHKNMYPAFKHHQSSSAVQEFSKIYEPSQNSKPQKCDMKRFPYWGPTNIRRHRPKFSPHGDMAPEVCAPLVYISSHQCKVPEFIHTLLLAWNLKLRGTHLFPWTSRTGSKVHFRTLVTSTSCSASLIQVQNGMGMT